MATNERQALQLRAQELINTSANGMSVREALKRAALEMVGNNVDAMADLFASVAASTMRSLRRNSYELPEDLTLFPLPELIFMRSPDGDIAVRRDNAALGHVRQWVREGEQHHATQRLRFKRFGEHIEVLKDEPDTLPWWSAKAMVCQSEEPTEPADDDGA